MKKYEARKFAIGNKESILKSKNCSCYSCLERYHAKEVTESIYEWADDIESAGVCPKCGVDAVLGDYDAVVDDVLLEEMKLYSFGEE